MQVISNCIIHTTCIIWTNRHYYRGYGSNNYIEDLDLPLSECVCVCVCVYMRKLYLNCKEVSKKETLGRVKTWFSVWNRKIVRDTLLLVLIQTTHPRSRLAKQRLVIHFVLHASAEISKWAGLRCSLFITWPEVWQAKSTWNVVQCSEPMIIAMASLQGTSKLLQAAVRLHSRRLPRAVSLVNKSWNNVNLTV